MDVDTIHRNALDAIKDLADGTAALVRTADPNAVPPGLEWSAREVAAHLISATTLYTELATGAPSPLKAVTPEALRVFNAERIADVADVEPEQLAKSIVDVSSRFVDVAADRPPQAPVRWHAELVLDTSQLTCVLLAEYLLHGLDLAAVSGAPWTIEPQHTALVLYGYGPVLPACVNPKTSAGHSARYRLDLDPTGQLAVQFRDGVVTVGPADDAPYDCLITADSTAFLLVSTGRMPQATAIALGLMSASGPRPELGLTFGSRFRYP
jgi:uncharacterized protein (TIGR03083 family)